MLEELAGCLMPHFIERGHRCMAIVAQVEASIELFVEAVALLELADVPYLPAKRLGINAVLLGEIILC